MSQEVVVKQDDGTYDAGDGWVRGYDNATQTPYIYNMEEVDGTVPQIISYDDPDSIRLKVEFAKANGMNGVMFWAMYGDTDEGELSAVLAEGRSTG